MVPMGGRRTHGGKNESRIARTTTQENDSESDSHGNTTLEDVPQCVLLWEIFSKVRNPRDLIVSKSVSKHWNSLVSWTESRYESPFALIVNIPAPDQPTDEPHYATDEPSLFKNWKGFKLTNLRCFLKNSGRPFCVQASCKDLLLCTKSYKVQQHSYVVNPVTMQWTMLPQVPHRGDLSFPVGLLADAQGYKVVQLHYRANYFFEVAIFNSAIGQWESFEFHHEPWTELIWYPTHYQGLAFNGVLHWLAKDGPVVAINVSVKRYRGGLIHRLQEMRHCHHSAAIVTECLDISRGHLRILQLVLFPTDGFSEGPGHHLNIWALENYSGMCNLEECRKKSEWIQKHRIYFRDTVSDVPWLQDYMREFAQRHSQHKMAKIKKFHMWEYEYGLNENQENREGTHIPEPLACHPSNPRLVYLHLPHSIVSLDLITKKLEIVSTISTQLESYWYDTVVPITLQLHPTPIPNPTKKSKR